jgi:hypothetical protein
MPSSPRHPGEGRDLGPERRGTAVRTLDETPALAGETR